MPADLEIILQSFDKKTFILAILSSPKKKDPDQPHKISISPLLLKNKPYYQVSSHFREKVFHKNLTSQECQKFIQEHLQNYKQSFFYTQDTDFHLLASKDGKFTILKKPPTKHQNLTQTHDRKKSYILQEGTPVPFLVELGVMTHEGKVVAKKFAKFRQVNRFLEIIRDILPQLKHKNTIHIVDFGCGKAYLTFALYHYLHHIEGYQLHITGLDLKEDVIQLCQSLAKNLKYENLHFSVGDIAQHQPKTQIDMVITLHACDTATDAALEQAIHWGAEVILSVPCCQHELYNQLSSPALDCLLDHGILKERFAALATDAARVQILKILGYEATIMEFIDFEHTPKNLLIRATKLAKKKDPSSLIKKYLSFKKLLNIYPSLEQRFTSILKHEERSLSP